MEIKTAEEILKESTDSFEENSRLKYDVLDAMKEYAEQFIELSYGHGISDGRTGTSGKEVTKSILKVKQLIK